MTKQNEANEKYRIKAMKLIIRIVIETPR